jgi:hypothetical protein
MRCGIFAANRKPIPGANTVKVVVTVPQHHYLPGRKFLDAVRETEGPLMQADRDFAVATHARRIEG